MGIFLTLAKRCPRLTQFYTQEFPPMILKQPEIAIVCSVRIGALYLICETSQWNTYTHKQFDETKQRAQWRPEART